MAYTTPRTWIPGELVTASMLQEQISDNMSALKAPPTAQATLNLGADITTTSTSFVDVDATNLSLTITTTGGDVLITFQGVFVKTLTGQVHLDVTMDGTALAGDSGMTGHSIGATIVEMGFTWWARSVAAGSHTFKLRWAIISGGGTLTLYAGAGSGGADFHPQFTVREVS